jgi:glycosyltransferase involved in cell wall biosynthesis
MPSDGSDGRVDLQQQIDALRHMLGQTQHAVESLSRRGTAGAVVTRWAGHTVALDPNDELVAQRDHLISVLRRMAAEADSLLASRRWRVGHFLARVATLPLPRRRHELASTRLKRLLDEIANLQPVAAHRTTVAASVASGAPVATGAWQVVPAATYDLVVLGNVPWASRWQRPQQLATVHAAAGHRVFYVATTNTHEGWEREVAEGIFDVGLPPATGWNRYEEVADPVLVSDWTLWFAELAQRHHIVDAVVHVHLASWQPLAAELRDRLSWRVIYDCMDEWEGFPGMGREVIAAEAQLAKEADLVIATAEVLRQKMSALNPNTLLVRNGVQQQFVSQVQPGDLLADLPHPLIGFTGAVAEWIDIDLLVELATLRPDWTFALLGDIFVPVEELRALPNVHLLGLQPYDKMPGALFWIDVAIIPFRVDEISHAVDPVKFYEYAASGTPVVSTRMPELDRVGPLCRQVDGAHGFVEPASKPPWRRAPPRLRRCEPWPWTTRGRCATRRSMRPPSRCGRSSAWSWSPGANWRSHAAASTRCSAAPPTPTSKSSWSTTHRPTARCPTCSTWPPSDPISPSSPTSATSGSPPRTIRAWPPPRATCSCY